MELTGRRCHFLSEYGGWRDGIFHRWVDTESVDFTTGTKVKALVECEETGHIEMVSATMVSFYPDIQKGGQDEQVPEQESDSGRDHF